MYMIYLNIEFHYLTVFLFAKCTDTVGYFNGNFTFKYPKTIFGHPSNMILAMPDCM